MKLPALSLPGADFMTEVAYEQLDGPWKDYRSEAERAGTAVPAPGALYERAYVDAVRTYAMNTELADGMLAALLDALPHASKNPGKGLDAVMGVVTLLHTRAAVQQLLQQDKAEDAMLNDVRNAPPTPSFDEGGKSRRELDRQISESAEEGRRATDDQIGDIAFGGNKEKIDGRIRDSAHAAGERREWEGVAESDDGVYRGRIKLPRMPRLHLLDPRDCFRVTTAWTGGGAIALATGEREPRHFPRLTSLFGQGVSAGWVRTAIADIIGDTGRLKAPERDKPDEAH